MVFAPPGHQLCRQANLMYRKSQRSWPTRAQDIVGKLHMSIKPQRSQPTRAQDIAGELHCLTASLGGLSHWGHKTLQASCVVGGWQLCKRHRGETHNHAKNCLNRRMFFAGKAIAHASSSILWLTRSAAIACKNPMRKRVKFAWLMEHHLKRRGERADENCCAMTFGGDYSGLYIFFLFCSPSTQKSIVHRMYQIQSQYITNLRTSTIDDQKHNSIMVSDASPGTAAPKTNKSFVHMAHVSSDHACAQDG